MPFESHFTPQFRARQARAEAEEKAINANLRQQQEANRAAAIEAAGGGGMEYLRNARAALQQQSSGGGYININGQVNNPNEGPYININGQEYRDAPPDAAISEAAHAALTELQSIEPLVRKGVFSADDVHAVVKSSAMGDIADQRNNRRAQRDMQAIVLQSQNGTFNEQQTVSAMESLKKTYGEMTLLNVPGYAEITGKAEQIKQHRLEQTQAYAEQNGLPPETFMWDEDTNGPVLNPRAVQVQQHKLALDQAKSMQVDMAWQNKRKDAEMKATAIGNRIKAVTNLMAQQQKAGHNEPALLELIQKLTVEQNTIFTEMQTGDGRPSAQQVAPIAPPRPITRSTTLTTFNSRDDFLTALRSGSATIGQRVLINGAPWLAHADGKIRPAN